MAGGSRQDKQDHGVENLVVLGVSVNHHRTVAVSFYFWVGDEAKCGVGECSTSWLIVQVADILRYFLPDFFSNIITFGVLKQPWWAGGLLVVVIVYYVVRQRFRRMSVQACDRARVLVLERAART